ncbi:hypothetical protein J0A67_00160 [Algoriphagus aestuariicola]|jgi:hypothetical protein|uniref:Uncharacterized protein n=1 Tax=Algoriphagus aestuariicola TaxID=1852016 RepID=A0ABS3BJX3_9BACT|nr:hypothetical protein [Algoriphagus aestuariicola]MBN7799246.1 hypothetical protein [Algoriphagus aestuariicola]
MKKSALLSLFVIGLCSTLFAQNQTGWSLPLHEAKFVDESGETIKLAIDPGFDYADLMEGSDKVRFFFNRNHPNFRQARIIDQDSNELVARGKGGFFFGDAKMVFADGSVVNLKKIKNPNGYEIIGPHGPLFKVENQGIKAVSTIDQKEFLTQTFFVFDRIRATQQPPAEVIYVYASSTLGK